MKTWQMLPQEAYLQKIPKKFNFGSMDLYSFKQIQELWNIDETKYSLEEIFTDQLAASEIKTQQIK